jgi:hypothetical protein
MMVLTDSVLFQQLKRSRHSLFAQEPVELNLVFYHPMLSYNKLFFFVFDLLRAVVEQEH